jgi:hypothetical protein
MYPWEHPIPPVPYKYFPPERFHVLNDCRVCFSQRKVFKDDHELSPDYLRFGTEREIWGYVLFHEINLRSLYDDDCVLKKLPIPDLVRLIANDDRHQDKMIALTRKSMKSPDEMGIFCLTEAADCEQMWSEYACNRTGFVLEFDTSCAGFDSLKAPGRFGMVSYSDVPFGSMLGAEDMEGAAGILFRKRMQYSFEREWRSLRLLNRLERGPAGIFLSRFDPASVRQIINRPDCTVETELQKVVATDERYRHVRIIHR